MNRFRLNLLSIGMIVLVFFVSIGAGFTATVPRIDSVTHNGFGTLMPGDTLTVFLRGESGGQASFDVTNLAMEVPMQEISPGVYQGSYTIDQPRDIAFASVTGHLRRNGREARLVAIKSVSIGGSVAQINPTLQLNPLPGFQVTSSRPRISATFQSMIQPSAATLIVDGVDYTSQIKTTNTVEWSPSFDLSPGQHHAVLWAVDPQGRQLRREWNFSVGATANNNLIQSVVAAPRTLMPGQTATITVQGTPGATAILNVEKGSDIVMTEGPAGTYTAAYVVPDQLQGRYAYLMVKLQTPDGRTEIANNADVIYVARPASSGIPLNINNPFSGSSVPQNFGLSGTTQPNALVTVRLWGPDNTGVWHEIANTQVRADSRGNFYLPLDSGNLQAGANIAMLARAQNDQGLQSDELRIGLTRQ